MDLKAGVDYQFITVSFDPTGTIDLGRQKKQSYIIAMKKKEAAEGWLFFVSGSADIASLTGSVGFNYVRRNNQFIHPTGLIALAPDRKTVRYLMGIDFLPFEVKITLVEAGSPAQLNEVAILQTGLPCIGFRNGRCIFPALAVNRIREFHQPGIVGMPPVPQCDAFGYLYLKPGITRDPSFAVNQSFQCLIPEGGLSIIYSCKSETSVLKRTVTEFTEVLEAGPGKVIFLPFRPGKVVA